MIDIATIPGDGIGVEVLKAGLYVLDYFDLNFEYKPLEAGRACFEKTGNTIPEETIKTAKKCKATLFGANTSTPNQPSPIITLRKALDVYGNLRPIKSFKGVNCLYDNLDFLIVRENTEGLYSGIEETQDNGNTAIATRVITKTASRRICNLAFNQAIKRGNDKVTAVSKSNVLKKTDGVFIDTFYNTAKDYPTIKTNDYYVDATAMYLLTKPQEFEVIVTTNLYGDILSDEAAGLVGGLGLAPSGNIGDENGLFEPVHGSAPDIAGKNISNPIAMLLSISMMLNYLEFNYEAKQLETACSNLLKKGNVLTPDLGGNAKTYEVADAIVCNLKELE